MFGMQVPSDGDGAHGGLHVDGDAGGEASWSLKGVRPPDPAVFS